MKKNNNFFVRLLSKLGTYKKTNYGKFMMFSNINQKKNFVRLNFF